MHDWEIRRARPGDAPGLASCVDAAYRHYVERIGKPPGPMLADYQQEIESHEVWVVDQAGHIIGGLVLIPRVDYLLLDNIAVHPEAQGQGIGRSLLELADAEALRQGYREIRLYTHEKMTENLVLYPHLGWEETGRGFQDGYQRVFFRKRLSS